MCFCTFHSWLWVFVLWVNWTIQAQHERADNSALRQENDKIRCENIAIREALKNVICPSCGGPPINDDCYFDEQKLRLENAQLKEEVQRPSNSLILCLDLWMWMYISFDIVVHWKICSICSLIEYLALRLSTSEGQFLSSHLFSLFIYLLWICQWGVLQAKGWVALHLILIFSQGVHRPCRMCLLSNPRVFRTWISPSCQTLPQMPWKKWSGYCKQMSPCGWKVLMGGMSLILIPMRECSPRLTVTWRTPMFMLKLQEIQELWLWMAWLWLTCLWTR